MNCTKFLIGNKQFVLPFTKSVYPTRTVSFKKGSIVQWIGMSSPEKAPTITIINSSPICDRVCKKGDCLCEPYEHSLWGECNIKQDNHGEDRED
jgi:hypothetical protein